MTARASLGFISLFVPSLRDAVPRYSALLGVAPLEHADTVVPSPHPFARKGPVVFELGEIRLALYECDGRTTHPGDVALGLVTSIEETAARMVEQGGQMFWGPKPVVADGRRMAIGMLPDRHFFELTEPDRPFQDR